APPPALENNPHLAPSLGHDYETALVEHALKKADTFQGGFGNQSKFPAAPQLLALLDAYARGPEARLGGFLQLTLDQMASQGLHDQLGGGFFRYAVDPGWQQPHFEKMLYDNALLAEVYLAAARVLHRPAYAAVARDTLDFMLRAMSTRRGAFVSSLSAVDGHGKDGGYYLWDRKAFRDALSPAQWRVAQRYWRLDSLPGGDLPLAGERAEQIAATLKLPEAQVAARVAAARRALLEVRSRRTLPRDDKVIAGWNGLALSALCRAAALPGGEKYRAAAQRLRDYLVHEMWNGTRLLRARVGGKPAGEGALEDYAYVAQGLAAWARLTHSRRDDALARALVLQGWKRFHVSGGWHLTQDDLLPYGATDPVLPDTALPSPSAVLARVTLALAARGADTKLRQQALAALNADSDLVASESYWFATQIAAVADYQSQAAGGGAAHR
ncbi:MAG: thioredoxin domain-containing protein, partial [Gammaproteobacteria bacterium]|nr:thioredoxin domain-containing protein [Gammaproteobacteria bacterium]